MEQVDKEDLSMKAPAVKSMKRGRARSGKKNNRNNARILIGLNTKSEILLKKSDEIKRMKKEMAELQNYQNLINAKIEAMSNVKVVTVESKVLPKLRQEKVKLEEAFYQMTLAKDENEGHIEKIKAFMMMLDRSLRENIKNFNDDSPSDPTRTDKFEAAETGPMPEVDPHPQLTLNKVVKTNKKGKKIKNFPKQEKLVRETNKPKIVDKNLNQKVKKEIDHKAKKGKITPLSTLNTYKSKNGTCDESFTEGSFTESSDESVADEFGDPLSPVENKNHKAKRNLASSMPDEENSTRAVLNLAKNQHRLSVEEVRQSIMKEILLKAGPGINFMMLAGQQTRQGGDRTSKRAGIMKNVMNSKDFKWQQNIIHKRKSQFEGIDSNNTQNKGGNSNDIADSCPDDKSSDGSALGASLYDEIEQELCQNNDISSALRKESKDGTFQVAKLPRNFIPVKVSFKVGTNTVVSASQIQRKRERIYRQFVIREIMWFLRDESLVGLKIFLQHQKEKYFIEGEVHGLETSDFVSFAFKEDESLSMLHFISDDSEMHHIKIVTSMGREFCVGKNLKAFQQKGMTPTIRYFPKEIKLFKLFSVFNSSTQKLQEIRFLYVRTVIYS
jgi:hypothetical protein